MSSTHPCHQRGGVSSVVSRPLAGGRISHKSIANFVCLYLSIEVIFRSVVYDSKHNNPIKTLHPPTPALTTGTSSTPGAEPTPGPTPLPDSSSEGRLCGMVHGAAPLFSWDMCLAHSPAPGRTRRQHTVSVRRVIFPFSRERSGDYGIAAALLKALERACQRMSRGRLFFSTRSFVCKPRQILAVNLRLSVNSYFSSRKRDSEKLIHVGIPPVHRVYPRMTLGAVFHRLHRRGFGGG